MPRIDHSHPRLTFLLTLMLSLAVLAAAAQDSGTTTPLASAPAPDREQVERRIEAVAADSELPDADRDAITTELEGLLETIDRVKGLADRAGAYTATLETAPRETARIREQLAEAAEDADAAPRIDLPDDAGLEAVDARVAAADAEISSLEARVSALDETLNELEAAPARLRSRAAELDAELAELSAAGRQPGADATAGDELSAWVRQSQRTLRVAERYMIEQELLSAPARRDLARAQRELAELELSRAKALRQSLKTRAEALRQEQAVNAQLAAEADRQAVSGADPLVRDLADENAELAASIGDTTAAMSQLDDERESLQKRIGNIDEDFSNARKRLESVGLYRALGQVLIDQRGQLPNPHRLEREAEARSDQIAESTLLSIRWREELSRLSALDTWVTTAIEDRDLEEGEREQLIAQLRAQAETRRTLLRTAIDVQERYRGALEELDFTARQLGDLSRRYDRYLQERLLWVRSIVPLIEQPFDALPSAVWWVLSPSNWAHASQTLLHEAAGSGQLWLGVLLVALLLWRGAAIKRAIRATAEPLRRISTDGFRHTLLGVALTLLAAAPWPLLMLTLGDGLADSLQGDNFAKAVGDAMMATAPALYYMLAFRMLCMRGGVADRHFRWRTETTSLLRNSAYLSIGLLMPFGIVAAMVSSYQDPDYTGTLGRLSLAAFELGLAALTVVVLRPTRGALKYIIAEHPNGWLSRLRLLWYPALIAVPVGLAVLALTGFLYTSGMLLRSLINELWLALGLIVAHQLIARWQLVTRRRLALHAALDRRAQREAAKQSEGGTAEAPAVPAVPEDEVDLATLDAQTRELLNLSIFIAAVVGLWLVWSDVLPALNLLERVTLWTYEGSVDGVSTPVPVTLADLGLVLLILATAIAAGRNLPALFEIILLQNSNLSAGSRYTIITLTGYTITAIGALLIFGTLGLSWGQVQWLVAALGVGIGFGLQEIVANFISGLIILFERPVRVGDVVTIGDTTGAVTKIEIRATTVRNWDRQELLVPNKELITGRLTNWTLSDTTNRVTIVVGAEYGCDTRKALQLLADAARENERVMDDPAPVISFEGFGNDSLTLVLRCFLGNLDYRIDTVTQLHQAIDDKFRAAGIGIAFPQRDVHLRAAEPLEVRLSRAHAPASPAPAGRESANRSAQTDG